MNKKGVAILNVVPHLFYNNDEDSATYVFDVNIEIDGERVLDRRYVGDYNETAVKHVLEALAYEVLVEY